MTLLPPTALLIFTDGRRDCLDRTLACARLALPWDEFTARILIDDSGSTGHYLAVTAANPDLMVLAPLDGTKRGFSGAIAAGWELLATHAPDAEMVFHLEDDFVFNRVVPLDRMADLLLRRPHLAQMALVRQPWSDDEIAAGGYIAANPDDFEQCLTATTGHPPPTWWIEHRRFFTTNPTLYRRTLTEHGWPQVEHSEGVFTHQLLADPDLRFGLWGRIEDSPWVHHIGDHRTGTGY